MTFSNDHVRRELRDGQRDHDATMAPFEAALDQAFDPSSGTDLATKAELVGAPSRRQLLKLGGLTIASTALLAACVEPASTDQVAVTGTLTPTPTTAKPQDPGSPEIDATLVLTAPLHRAARHRHLPGRARQQLARRVPLLVDVAKYFQSQHQDHAGRARVGGPPAGPEPRRGHGQPVPDHRGHHAGGRGDQGRRRRAGRADPHPHPRQGARGRGGPDLHQGRRHPHHARAAPDHHVDRRDRGPAQLGARRRARRAAGAVPARAHRERRAARLLHRRRTARSAEARRDAAPHRSPPAPSARFASSGSVRGSEQGARGDVPPCPSSARQGQPSLRERPTMRSTLRKPLGVTMVAAALSITVLGCAKDEASTSTAPESTTTTAAVNSGAGHRDHVGRRASTPTSPTSKR